MSLCWLIRTVLRQSVIVLTNQNYCISTSLNALIMLLLLLVDIYLFLCMCMYVTWHMHGGERRNCGNGVRSQGPAQGVRQSLPAELPRSTFLTFLFPLRYSWRHQLREFKSEYRVVALDLRGYGESDAPTHQESYKLDCLIADIKDILDSLGRLAFWILLMCAYVFLCLCGCMLTCVCRDLQSSEEGTGVFGSHRYLWACSAHWDPHSSLLMEQ